MTAFAQAHGVRVVPISSGKADSPTAQDWTALHTVCSSISCILDDEPTAPAKGLLANIWSTVRGNQEGGELPKRSVLGARVAGRVEPLGMAQPSPLDWDAMICNALPGVHNLGHSRAERIANLSRLLGNLPAYEWLKGHEAFRAAVATMRGRVSSITPAYGTEVAEFQLMEAVAMPLARFHILTARNDLIRFPTPDEADEALQAAKQVLHFLSVNTGIGEGYGFGWNESAAARLLVDKLAAFVPAYKSKGKDGLTRVQRQTLTAILENVRRLFGKESPAVLIHLARLAGGYVIDGPNLAALIRDIDGVETAPKAQPAKTQEAPGVQVRRFSMGRQQRG